jgi:hypothetical protein
MCFSALILRKSGTLSHGVRQFPEWRQLYVIECVGVAYQERVASDWHVPCSPSQEVEIVPSTCALSLGMR